MKFFNINDTAAFFDRILSCSGNVYCRASDGSLRDLKHAARQAAEYSWLVRPGRMDEIDVIVELPADGRRLQRFMMEACRAR